MSDSPNRDVEIFVAAIHLPATERAAYLDLACGSDTELRREVLALLQHHDSADDLLERSPHGTEGETKLSASIGVKMGDRLGRYKLLQQIGEGGCGVVYLAEQEEPVRRRVALKVIKPGMDTKSVIARFEAERQALALMDHPNIAKVLDAGATESGRPYFVMELVQGVKITDYCDQNSFSTQDRLKLFIQVCHAIQHAHQKGIIHRDIKPSNILVSTSLEGEPLPVVIDFGIAKATTKQQLTDKTFFTALEMLIGTPAYMSPEQAEFTKFDLDTRTDIYSLGVLLYELLTGSTPFDMDELFKAGLDEIRRVIREQEPARPSTQLSKLTRENLTVIAQRHHSEPPALIRAVRGDLDWIVMKALEKDRTRRYETANGLALDVQRFLADETILARPPSALYKFRKTVSRNKLLFGSIGAITLLLIASLIAVTASLTKEQHESAKSRQVTRFLEEMLGGVGPSVARGRDTTMLKEILDETADRTGKELHDQPEVEAELRNLIGTLYREIGNYDTAEDMHRAAIAIRRKVFGPNSWQTAESLNDLGLDLMAEQKLSEAEAVVTEALDIRQQLFGMDNPNTATSLNDLGAIYRDRGKYNEAEKMAREALKIRQKFFGQESYEVADSLRNLSIILGDEGNRTESEAMAREILAMQSKLIGPADPELNSALDDVAWAADANGKVDEAKSLEIEALAMQRQSLSDKHPYVAKSLYLLGERMREQGNLTEADAMVSAALSIQRKLLGEDHPDTLYTLRSQAGTLESEGKWTEAESSYREVLTSWRRRAGNEDPQTLDAAKNLVRVLVDEEKFPEAVQILDEELTPNSEKQTASVDLIVERADLMGRQGRWREADADAVLACKFPTVDPFYFHMQAVLLAKLDERPAYEQLCAQILPKFTDTSNPYAAERVVKDCLLLPHSGVDLQTIDKLADRAISLGKDDHSGLPWFETAKAFSDYRLGRFSEAIEWAEKVPKESSNYAQAHAWAIMAMARWQLGQEDAARQALIRGESLAPNLVLVPGSMDLGDSWVAMLEARITLDEASALIQPASTVAVPPNKL